MSEAVGIGTATSSQFADAATETVGEHRIRGGAIAVMIGGIALWLYQPFAANTLNVVDGGEAAYKAARVLDGHSLASDLGTRYGPVQYYVRALLFGLFGKNLGMMSKEFVVLSALFVAASYWVLRGSSARVPARRSVTGGRGVSLPLPCRSQRPRLPPASDITGQYARRQQRTDGMATKFEGMDGR